MSWVILMSDYDHSIYYRRLDDDIEEHAMQLALWCKSVRAPLLAASCSQVAYTIEGEK